MKGFYAQQFDSQARAEALRAARLALKAHDRLPIVWGALIPQAEFEAIGAPE